MTELFSISNFTIGLLAETRVSDLAPEYRPPEPESWLPMVAALSVVGVVAIGLAIWFRYRLQVASPIAVDSLTRELSDGYRLGSHHVATLQRTAEAAGLVHVAEWFLSRSHFDAAFAHAQSSGRLARADARRLSEICRYLYATD